MIHNYPQNCFGISYLFMTSLDIVSIVSPEFVLSLSVLVTHVFPAHLIRSNCFPQTSSTISLPTSHFPLPPLPPFLPLKKKLLNPSAQAPYHKALTHFHHDPQSFILSTSSQVTQRVIPAILMPSMTLHPSFPVTSQTKKA